MTDAALFLRLEGVAAQLDRLTAEVAHIRRLQEETLRLLDRRHETEAATWQTVARATEAAAQGAAQGNQDLAAAYQGLNELTKIQKEIVERIGQLETKADPSKFQPRKDRSP